MFLFELLKVLILYETFMFMYLKFSAVTLKYVSYVTPNKELQGVTLVAYIREAKGSVPAGTWWDVTSNYAMKSYF
jgi:hypothetical protein